MMIAMMMSGDERPKRGLAWFARGFGCGGGVVMMMMTMHVAYLRNRRGAASFGDI
jgi:hypothetical protein